MKNFLLSILALFALLICSCTSGTLTIDSPDDQIFVSITTGSDQEAGFREMMLDDPLLKERSGLPFLMEVGENVWVAITEANLTDWAGMYLIRTADNTLETVLSPWPDDPGLLVKSQAPRSSPW